ncbi:MAG: endolytic transglycosylase MltG [Armatimonadota bacterium]
MKLYIVVPVVVLVIVGLMIAIGMRPVSSDKTPVRVVVMKGSTARGVSRTLGGSGLIRSPFVFVLACRMSGASATLKPGVYELKRSMGVSEMIDRLVSGRTLENWVTMPEGFTARQMSDALKDRQLISDDAFLRLVIEHGNEFSDYAFVYGNDLEGYLFPDTYLVAKGADSGVIVREMLDAFEKKVVDPNRGEIENVIRKRFGLGKESFAEGLYKLITVASMIEREAKIPSDRPLVSAVFWNRLANGMRLEVCATVSYSPGVSADNKSKVYYTDLRKDSPYNTYMRAGLPAGPICNPGLESIKAAMRPASVDYLFYVARRDGGHKFSRTFKEHVAAKNAIRNGRM